MKTEQTANKKETPINIDKITLQSVLKNLLNLFPLTFQGVASLLLATFALSFYGYRSMDLVVFSLAICALAILVFCLFCCVISGIFIQRAVRKTITKELTAKPIRLEAGFPNETGFYIVAPNYLPLVKLSWEIVHPDFLETRIRLNSEGHLLEEVVPQRRCKTNSIVRRFSISDVLGFCKYCWHQKQEVDCLILPQVNTMKALPLIRSLTAEDGIPNSSGDPEGDRMEIRPYVPGDSVRNIMWKVFARNRQLNVRLAEKSVFHSNRTAAYLLSSQDDEAASAVARVAIESGALGDDWVFSADGNEDVCNELQAALTAIASSRAVAQPHSYGLDNFLNRVTAQNPSNCIVFAAAEFAPWLPQLKNTIARYSGQFTLVLATDEIREAQTPSKWRRILLRDLASPEEAGVSSTSTGDLLKLLTEIGQLVESALVVDRKSGCSFDQKLRKV